jgi:uncharacterized protein YacL
MILFLRIVFLATCVYFGFAAGFDFVGSYTAKETIGGAVIGLALGVFVIFLDLYFKRVTVRSVLAIFLGVLLGLLFTRLLIAVLALTAIPPQALEKVGMISALLFSYLGAVTIYRGQDEFTVMIPFVKLDTKSPGEQKILLDTSVVIDGRIADICETSFLSGRLIVPRFVLKELQLIADSADDLKRNRGRRGLDVLNRVKNNPNIEVRIHEADFPEHSTVDAKLVKLAQVLGAKVFTNDYNLNKIAELQGVTVLNINELSNALKPIVMPGEFLTVKVLKEGKEPEQGVAYLDDGTMVVVDAGRRKIGQAVTVTITSVLQTSAGRMIFAKVADDR